MNIISIFLLLIVITYGGLTILGAAVQIKQGKLNAWSISLMIAGASLIIVSTICTIISGYGLIYLVIIGLTSLHVSAVINGFTMYGKIHFKHHAIRLVISSLIVFLYFVSF